MNLVELRVTTTGGDGVATGTATTALPISGKICSVVLNYHASAPASTDVNLYMATAPSDLILDYDNHNTDITLYPRKPQVEADGTGLTYNGAYMVPDYFVVHGTLTLAIAGCNALTDAVIAYILYE